MSASRWEVLTQIGNDWENVWEEEEGVPQTFESYAEAKEELLAFLTDVAIAVRASDMSSPLTLDQFRIAELDPAYQKATGGAL